LPINQSVNPSINKFINYLLFIFSIFAYLLICFISLTGNYRDSLRDAKVAIALQPSYIKAIVRGKFS